MAIRKPRRANAGVTRKPKGGDTLRQRWRAESKGALCALSKNLLAGLRTAFFLKVDSKSWTVSPGQLTAVALIAVALGVALNRTFYSGPVLFNWDGLRGQWVTVPFFLLVGWFASHFATRRISALTAPVALFAVSITTAIVVSTALHLIKGLPPQMFYRGWAWLYWGYELWIVGIAAVFLYRAARLALPHVLLVVFPLIALAAFDLLNPRPPLWYQMPDANHAVGSERESAVSEEMLYLQPRLAEQTVNALAAHRRGIAEFYFVAFAPYGRQNVFLKESEAIRALMDERFDTARRSLLLVNNDKTLRTHPLATVTNLRAALARIATVIDTDEDVLVLYLTSHGSKQHRLSADYWPLQLQEVEPALLKQLLDEVGIKWRVVIVSACYSGGFIEPLRGPTTLVMTAADATHTSFGCGNESDFTYFAKALFDEQLRATYSFEEAFRRALPVIREREKKEGNDFSNPQLAAGDGIGGKLAEIERRLAARPVNVSPE